MIGFPNTNSDLLNITLQRVEELQKENDLLRIEISKLQEELAKSNECKQAKNLI
jgi:uncharacterized small protein (DUF1192 family)